MHKKEFGKGSLGGNEIQGMIERGRGSGREWREAMGREGKAKGGEGAAGGGGCRAGARDAGKPGRVHDSQLPSVAREPAPEREAGETAPQAALRPPSTRTYARTHAYTDSIVVVAYRTRQIFASLSLADFIRLSDPSPVFLIIS